MLPRESFDEFLDALANELPDEFYRELNGGIIVRDRAKRHPQSRGGLYIMGEYRRDRALGRSIVIYYGSFERVFGDLPRGELIKEMRKTLRHEFRHHIESLAGENALERRDAEELSRYLRGGCE